MISTFVMTISFLVPIGLGAVAFTGSRRPREDELQPVKLKEVKLASKRRSA